jgi:hypothetical protein
MSLMATWANWKCRQIQNLMIVGSNPTVATATEILDTVRVIVVRLYLRHRKTLGSSVATWVLSGTSDCKSDAIIIVSRKASGSIPPAPTIVQSVCPILLVGDQRCNNLTTHGRNDSCDFEIQWKFQFGGRRQCYFYSVARIYGEIPIDSVP